MLTRSVDINSSFSLKVIEQREQYRLNIADSLLTILFMYNTLNTAYIIR
jgi:hypothetical protein